MQVIAHEYGSRRLAEIKALKLASFADLTALMLHARIHRCDGIILDETFVGPEFFRLTSGLMAQVLAGLHNYRFTLAIVGDISRYTKDDQPLRDFIANANRGKDLRFAATVADVLARV